MNLRQKNILEYLVSNKDASYTLQELADQSNCSTRTIRNDLAQISQLLATRHYEASLIKKPGVGISLATSPYERRKLMRELLQADSQQASDDVSRKELLLATLLMSQHPLTLDDLAERFYVNRTVIREDIDSLREQTKGYKLDIISKPRLGNYIEGSERERRDLLAQVMKKINQQAQNGKGLLDFFPAKMIERVNHSLKRLSETTAISIKNNPLNSITIHILFMIERIKHHQSLVLSTNEWDLIKYSKALDYARTITTELSQNLGLNFPEDEIGYLALRISSFNIHNEGRTDTYYEEMKQTIEKITYVLIAEVSQLLEIDLSDDRILRNNLQQHLDSTFTRINSGFHISNPLKAEIMRAYTQLFMLIQVLVEELLAETDLVMPEEEIAYLTVHLQGAIERQKKVARRTFKSVIICEFGMGVSAFLEAKIKRIFPTIDIQELLSISELASYEKLHELDFIISTIPYQHAKLPVLEISPLLEERDLTLLRAFLVEYAPPSPTKYFDISLFSQPFLVETQVEAETKEEVITQMVHKLSHKGYVSSSYLESVQHREETSSTRIGHLVALPHGNPQEVNYSSISIATLDAPVEWGNGAVQLVVLLGLKKQDLGRAELKEFFSVLHYLNEHPHLLTDIINETDKLKVLEYFTKYE